MVGARRGKRETKLVDLVAKVRLADGEGFVLIHIEHQARRQRDIGKRMFLYAAWLMHRYQLPVYPILLTSYDQPLAPEPNRYQVEVRGFRVLDFRFRVVQLNRLDWHHYARTRNPAAAALMSKMRIAPKERVKVKLQMLRLIATLRLEPAKMELIAGFMENYLALNAQEELAFQAGLDKIENSKEKNMVMQLVTSWERKGRQEGLEEGRHQGLVEGQLGTVKRQLRVLLGRITPSQEKQIDSLDDKKISDLAAALLKFSNTRDLETWLSQQNRKPR